MATPTVCKDRRKVTDMIIRSLQLITPVTGVTSVGAGTVGRIRRNCWVCAGTPSGAAPDGMLAGDLILDTTNQKVYRYISDTTYINMTAIE